MGRIIVTTDNDSLVRIKKKNNIQGFEQNREINFDNFCCLTYFKKIKKIENAFVDGKDWCCSSGSLMYKGRIGIEALKTILNDFKGNVDDIRKIIIGNYFLAIKKENKIYLFVDKYNIYKVFYQLFDGQILLSSDIIDVMLWKNSLDVSEFNLMLESFQCSPYGEDTFINGINKLLGREYIEIDCQQNAISIKEIPYYRIHNDYATLDQAAETIADRIKLGYTELRKAFGNHVGINMTGGMDSRTVLAGCLAANISPVLIHAQGNSPAVTGTEVGDLKCVESIGQLLDLKVVHLNWDCDYPDNFNDWDELFEKYGFDYKLYGGNPNFFKSYTSLSTDCPDIMETGLFGECMRIREQYNDTNKSFQSADAFINEYQLKGTNSNYIDLDAFYPNSAKLKAYMIKRFKEELEHFGFDPNGELSMDEFEEQRYIHHRATDAVLVNFLNQFTGCMTILGTEQVCEYIYDAKKEYRAYGKLQLKIIHNLYSKLLDVPFFSHRCECSFNKKEYRLVRNLHFHEKVGIKLRNIGLNNTLMYLLVRDFKNIIFKSDWKVQRDIIYNRELKEILPAVKNSIIKDQSLLSSYVNVENMPENNSLIHLIYYAMNLKGLNNLKVGRFL
jgi:hypothetical protein